ncbi:helix-turn-helix domain-containing protein [Paracoccus sp. Ld10]|uniref:helix-turn-helix domain-containing protein n=1 Tax=Paracoccus sp. Ld10 TaxID=649158 RepID=UPI0038704F64
MDLEAPSFGNILRTRRRFSQLALALEADISQRHLSFVEAGRSKPSREVILRLSEHLDVPLRERNAMLVAAGYAPAYEDRPLTSPDMARTREIIERLLVSYQPHPALALDDSWTILAMNSAASVLTEGVDPSLLKGEVNALRLTLHPQGLAPRIINLQAWRDHVLRRLAQDIDMSGNHRLVDLLEELKSYPVGRRASTRQAEHAPDIAVPLILDHPRGRLSFLSATTIFGTAVNVTLADIVIETFLPIDHQTGEILRSKSSIK